MSQCCRANGYPLFPLPGYLPPSPVVPSGFGPQGIQFLASITVLAGTDFTALANLATGGLPLPYVVEVIIGGALQTWALTSGVFPGAAPGYLQPNDYSAQNLRYWTQGG